MNHNRTSLFLSSSAALALLFTLMTAPAHASSEDRVGLGAAVGASWPIATEAIEGGIEGVSFDWGFFVDIPIIKTFHITPAAMLYKLKVGNEWHTVTDIDLNFKFIIPIRRLSIHAGITGGLTAGADSDADTLTAHMGLLGGLSFNLIANFDIFALVQYKILFHDLEKINDLHTYLGVMFRF